MCVCLYLRRFNNHSYTFWLQSLRYPNGNLLSQSLLNWNQNKTKKFSLYGTLDDASFMLLLRAHICRLLTLKPTAEDLHNPAEIRTQAKPRRFINNDSVFNKHSLASVPDYRPLLQPADCITCHLWISHILWICHSQFNVSETVSSSSAATVTLHHYIQI